MIDHAKRLAEIGATAAAELSWDAAREQRGWLLAEHRAASKTLAAAGIPDDGRSLAERVKSLAAVAGRDPAPDIGGVSPAHLRALEIIAYSDGTAAQTTLAGELVGMGPPAVAEAVCRAYEEGRAAEVRKVKAERDRLRAAVVGANNALAEVCHGDHEHQIECHADTLPAQYRRVAVAAEQASEILAEVVLDLVEQESQASTLDMDEAAEAAARCARGEHRKAGETMPGSCADCGVDWGDLDTEGEPSTGLDVPPLTALACSSCGHYVRATGDVATCGHCGETYNRPAGGWS